MRTIALRTLVARLASATLLAGALAVSVSRDAQAQRRRYSSRDAQLDTTVAFSKTGTVNVSTGSGDVHIVGWSRDQVHVRGESDGDNLRFEVSTLRGAPSLTVSTSRGGGTGSFEVSVPYGVRVVVYSQSGDVSVRGTRGAVDARAQSGDAEVDGAVGRVSFNSFSGGITATSILGDIVAETISGDVKLSDVRGDIDATTVSGEIEMRGVTSKVVKARTTSGDVVYDGLIDPAGRYELGAHSGDIRMRVQRDASAQIAFSTWSGSIDSDFRMTLNPGDHSIGALKAKQFTFSIGAGAARITADTFNGDITISSNGRGASVRP